MILQILPLLLFSPFTVATNNTEGSNTGLLIAGGYYGGKSVEFWAPPNKHCSLPSLRKAVPGLSIDSVQGQLIACYWATCDLFAGAMWVHWHPTLETRYYHSSAVLGTDLFLIGGEGVSGSELMPLFGENRPGFSIGEGRENHCTIKAGENSLVITGGRDTPTQVTEYSGLVEGQVQVQVQVQVQGQVQPASSRELPSLKTGRSHHACGYYTKSGSKMLIVTGGNTKDKTVLDTTEVYDYSQGGTWRTAGALPSPRRGVRGASLGGIFHVTGGYYKDHLKDPLLDILAWDPNMESWSLASNMDVPRDSHAVAEIPVSTVEKYCPLIN